MKNFFGALSFIAAISLASSAQANSYAKVDLGYRLSSDKFTGIITPSVTETNTLTGSSKKSSGVLGGIGLGYQSGEIRSELMVSYSQGKKKMSADYINSSPSSSGIHEIQADVDTTTVMLNMYYDKFNGMVSPYVMGGIGYAMSTGTLKDKVNGYKFKTKKQSGAAGQVELGVTLLVTDNTMIQLGYRLGAVHYSKKKRDTVSGTNSVRAKYGLNHTLVTSLRIPF